MSRTTAIAVLAALVLAAVPAPARAAPTACPDGRRLPPSPFGDVGRSVHRSAIVCAVWYDVVNGTSRDTFAPGRAMRRDQFASYLARLWAATGRGVPAAPAPRFSDVDGSVHRGAISTIARLGVVTGTADGQFRPAARISRRLVAAWLVGLAAAAGVEAADPPDAFRDDDGTPHEAAINAAAALGLVRGRADGTFVPGARVRRDQAASALARAIRLLVARGVLDARPIPAFAARRTAIPADMRRRMTGATWRRGCPVRLDRLVVLSLRYWDFAARPRRGRLVVARSVSADVTAVFARLYRARFQIRQIRPVHTFARGEAGSLSANNTSGFNCRAVTGGRAWSAHSYGTAIDINPRQNPYVKGGTVLPAAGRRWVRRTPIRRGMIGPRGPVVSAFDAIGWGWGGRWRTLKDYQHFSRSGR